MKTTDFIKENFVADAAEAHQDHEVQMARSDCYNAAKYAIELHKLLKNISEQEGLDGWVSEKITLANDYLRTVTEYLRYEQQSDSTGMPEFDVGSATQSLDAALSEGAFTWYLRSGGEFLTPYTSNEPYKFQSKEEAIEFAKKRYKAGWEKIVTPTPYNVPNALANQPDAGWDEKRLNVQHEDEEPEQKQKVVIKTNKPIGTRVADIGPGGKEYNVKTDKAWDDQHKEVDEGHSESDPLANRADYAKQHGTGQVYKKTYPGDKTGMTQAYAYDIKRTGPKGVLPEDEGDPEGLPHLTKELLTHIIQQAGKEGAHAIVKSLEWGDGAAKELLHLIIDDLKDDVKHGIDEGKADPTGSWVVYNGSKVKRFKSRDGAKAYAEKNGGKVASSEFYADNIQNKGVAESASAGATGSASIATTPGGKPSKNVGSLFGGEFQQRTPFTAKKKK